MPTIDRTDRVLADVLDQITPTQKEQEKTRELVDNVVNVTNQIIRGKGLDLIIAGSFARDTWMKDKKEFDIFIRFPVSTSRDDLESRGLEIGKQIAKILHGRHTIAYAEHPYVRIKVKNYDVDVVPCYRVESAMKIKSAVDRTPFHNDWLSRHFLKKLAPDVRLLKQFCKGIGVYGSDAKTQGFSGYLCELLIINYRTFKNVTKKASSWAAGKTIINLEGVYPIKDIRNIHKKFIKQPLIVIDPVDPGRNVAAALSPFNFIRFMKACRDFSKTPSAEYFFNTPPKPNVSGIEGDLTKRKTRIMGFYCTAPKIIEDVLWPQLRRTSRRVKDILENSDFHVHDYNVWSDGKVCIFFYEMEVSDLPHIRKIEGPSIFSETQSRNFLSKYRPLGRVWVENEFWVSEVKRAFTDSFALLDSATSGTENSLRSSGIASYIAKEITKSRKLLKKRDIIAYARKDKAFGQYLQDFLEISLS
jgi:tRNA nucleotidyltransferase (CCA-adding enzyme)